MSPRARLNLPEADRMRPLEQWLRGRLRREAWFQFFEGSFYALIALGCLAITIFAISFFVGALFSFSSLHVKGDPTTSHLWGATALVAGLVALLFIRGYFLRSALGYSESKARNQEEMPGGVAALYSAIFSGPGLFMLCLENFIKCWRLWRCNIAPLAKLVLWLYQQHSKTTVEEIMETLPTDEAVKLIPQLRLIPGMIWLEYGHGAVILSGDLRQSLVALLIRKRIRLRINTEPPPPKQDEATNFGRPMGGDPEIIRWYLALNLPPFATLDQVKKRYRQLVKIHHPDANAGARPGVRLNSDEQIRRINEAYHNIINQTRG